MEEKIRRRQVMRKTAWTTWAAAALAIGVLLGASGSLRASSRRAFLGVAVENVPHRLEKKFGLKRGEGVLIVQVEDDSPADYADLERGDVILSVDGKKVRSPAQLRRYIRRHKPGNTVRLEVIHDGKPKTVEVELARRPHRHREEWSFCVPEIHVWPVTGAYLGVRLQELNEDLARYFGVEPYSGVLIAEVLEDSPAERAGLKAGDILTAIDGEEVESPQDVRDVLRDYEPGDEAELAVVREGKEKKIRVTLGKGEEGRERIYFFNRPFRFDFHRPFELFYDDFELPAGPGLRAWRRQLREQTRTLRRQMKRLRRRLEEKWKDVREEFRQIVGRICSEKAVT